MSGDIRIGAIGAYENPPSDGDIKCVTTKASDKDSLFSMYKNIKKGEKTTNKEITDKYIVNQQQKNATKEYNKAEVPAYIDLIGDEHFSAERNKISVTDKVSNFLNSNSPDFVFDMLPDDILNNTYNRMMLNNVPIDVAMKGLPKNEDGSYNIEKIKESLKYAVDTIKAANNDAIKKMNYGTYKNFINGADIYNLLLGPEISRIAEQKGLIEPLRTISVQDTDALKVLSKIFDFELPDGLEFKDSYELKEIIEKQNKQLDNLLKIDLSTETGIKALLYKYSNITHTSFSCEEIEKAKEMMQPDSGIKKGEKFKQYVKTFGSVENYVDVWKNELYTNIAYEVIFKIVIPKVINNSVPYGKFFAPFIPAVVETHETLSTGLKDGEIINKDNVTAKEFFRILADGGIHAIIVSDIPMGKFGDGLRETKVPEAFQKNKLMEGGYKTLYRWVRGGAKAVTVGGSSKIPSISGAMFDKNASKYVRVGSAIFNMMTGYVMVPAGIIDLHGNTKNAE